MRRKKPRIFFQAFDAHGRRRVQLARQALELDPDCATRMSSSLNKPVRSKTNWITIAKGWKRGAPLGSSFFSENMGDFWGISTTRPYMRARLGLAASLAAMGNINEAVAHYQELLRLNPGDNQGVRYFLLPKLLAAGRDLDAAKLLKQYDEESANWAYARALLAFRLSGRGAAASRELRTALRINAHLPELLCSDAAIPQPPHYAFGSFEEACVAAEELRPAFQAAPGALDWILEERTQREHELDKRRREKRRKERSKQNKRKGR